MTFSDDDVMSHGKGPKNIKVGKTFSDDFVNYREELSVIKSQCLLKLCVIIILRMIIAVFSQKGFAYIKYTMIPD